MAVGAVGSGVMVGEFTIVPRSRPGAGEYGFVSSPPIKIPEGKGDAYYYGVRIKSDHTIPGVRAEGAPKPDYTKPPTPEQLAKPEERAKAQLNQRPPSAETTGARLGDDTLSALNQATRDIGVGDEIEDPAQAEASETGPGGVKDESKMTLMEKLLEELRKRGLGLAEEDAATGAASPFGGGRRGGLVSFSV